MTDRPGLRHVLQLKLELLGPFVDDEPAERTVARRELEERIAAIPEPVDPRPRLPYSED